VPPSGGVEGDGLLWPLRTPREGGLGNRALEPLTGDAPETGPTFESRLAETLGRLGGEARPAVLARVAEAAAAVRSGSVCVELDAADADLLATSPLVATPDARPTEAGTTPLVLDGARLYLRRWFDHERTLAQRLVTRAAPALLGTAEARAAALDTLFADAPPEAALQRAAAATALERRLTIVVGGPGTGKTTTVVKLLGALVAVGGPQHVRLLAPTGKAAARLEQAVAEHRASLPESVQPSIPTTASTIHRALGAVGGSRVRFRHDAEAPLPDDVVVVDEASMVDLALMRRLVEAVPARARLVLLGDRDQLASVEAGAVLAELCTASDTALDGCVVALEHSWRFAAGGGIGALADAIRTGDVDAAFRALRGGGEVSWVPDLVQGPLPPSVVRAVRTGYTPLARARSDAAALAALSRFKLLCAHRRGRFGVDQLNPRVEHALADAGLLRPTAAWYPGRPLLVAENDYRLGLFNGDQGVIRSGDDGLRACFAMPDGEIRRLAPARLPSHETVFAMSVHKSQGSEYDRVALVLPKADSPLLTRELLYTAVTRARKGVLVVGPAESVAAAVRTPVQRAGGLGPALRKLSGR
jgi:exodeoxyribonuclease V alpha subunit